MLINFPYIKRDSPVHRLDPRAKVLLLFGFGIIAAQTSNFWFMLAGLLGSIYYYSQAHLKWVETRRIWILIITANLLIILINYFISGGAVVQGVDLSHQHVLFNMPFLGLKSHAPYI